MLCASSIPLSRQCSQLYLPQSGDEILKSFSLLTEAVLDPNGEQSPMKRALGVSSSEPLFNWMVRPENRLRANRFNIAMHGDSQREQALGANFKGTSSHVIEVKFSIR
jgi:hypothetical protein